MSFKTVGENSSRAVFCVKGANVLQALEKEIEDALYQLIELEVEEEILKMSQLFAKLLASIQKAGLIDFNMDILVDRAQCLPQTAILLDSLLEAKRRFHKRGKLLTHRDILKIWLRKNKLFKMNYLPGMF